jgi:hypothetical protein
MFQEVSSLRIIMDIYRSILKTSFALLILTINAALFGMERNYQRPFPISLDMYKYHDEIQNIFVAPHNIISYIQQPDNPTLIKIRKSLGSTTIDHSLENPHPSIEIIGREKHNARFGRCMHRAMIAILGITDNPGILKMMQPHHWTTDITLMQYFDQTNNPKKADLVVYYRDLNNLEPLHFGVVTGFNKTNNSPIITSKWGTRTEIITHALFSVPLIYGKIAKFFTLKSIYQHMDGKIALIGKLQGAIKISKPIQKELAVLKKILLTLANGQNVTIHKILNFDEHRPILDKVFFLLKDYPGLNINARNKSNHHTALMLATIRDDFAMVNLLINFGANLKKQDKKGNTALMIAENLKYNKIAQLLRRQITH